MPQTKSKVILISGGPGLSPSYLRPTLDQVFKDNQRLYIDTSKAKTAAEAIGMTVKSLTSAKLNAGDMIFAHSWGSFLALEAVKALGSARLPCFFVLSNPVPLMSSGLPNIQQTFRSRLTADELAAAEEALSARGPKAGAAFFEIAMKAYCGDSKRHPDLAFKFWPEREAMVNQSQGRYSHKQLFAQVKNRTLTLWGARDYITAADFGAEPRYSQTLAGGHFAFAEDPLACKRAIVNFLLKMA